MTHTKIWLTCVDCEQRVRELWDARCSECFYVRTGGDLGQPHSWSKHVVVRDGSVHLEYK